MSTSEVKRAELGDGLLGPVDGHAPAFPVGLAGGLDDLFTINDDDSIDHTEYNLSNPAADWTSMTSHSDKDGNVTDAWTFYRGGEQTHTVYDYDNTKTWHSVDYNFDSNGTFQKSVTLYDDGHEWTRF